MKRINGSEVGANPLASALMAACMATFSAIAAAQPIAIGQTVSLRNNTTYNDPAFPLTMDGGVLSIRNTTAGAGVTVTAFDAILRNGVIANGGPQAANTINFFGITKVESPTTPGPFPANYMHFSAPSESPWTFTNRGDLVQSSDLVLMGDTTLRNAAYNIGPVSRYTKHYLDTDAGILGDPQKSGIPGAPFPVIVPFVGGFQGGFSAGLRNDSGAALIKRGGTGTSEIRVPVAQNSATVQTWSGTLTMTNSGSHHNSGFYADPFGINPGYANPGNLIIFGANNFGGGNMHVFTGINTTETGRFVLDAGVMLRVTSNNLFQPNDEWRQRALFVANGTIDLDGARLVNTGALLAADITGRSNAAGGVGFLDNKGYFSGNIRAGTTGFNVNPIETVRVINSGEFVIASDQTVQAGRFENFAGSQLVVNGVLSNYGGTLRVYGGSVLSGNGTINSDVFVGSQPGPARFTPGSSPGTMTINGDFSLLPGGELDLEIESTPDGIAFDRLVISGSILLNGHVNFFVGSEVATSDVVGINFFDCNGPCSIEYGAEFSWDLPGRPGSQLEFSAAGLQITALAPVPEPRPFALLLAGLGLVGWLVRRRQQPGQ